MDDQPQYTHKIVLVEDTESLADIYKTRLEAIGYQCIVAANGKEALAIIEREKPDLVLLDLMLPILSGDQVLTIMRSQAWGKNIRVFIMSNLDEADAPPGLRDLGIEGYAVKFDLTNEKLDQQVNTLLRSP